MKVYINETINFLTYDSHLGTKIKSFKCYVIIQINNKTFYLRRGFTGNFSNKITSIFRKDTFLYTKGGKDYYIKRVNKFKGEIYIK